MIKEILKRYKEEFKQCLNDLKHKETFYKQIPNLITIIRPLGMIPANILFFTGHPLAAVIFTALLLSTDFIDGKLARKWHVQSKLGADLDAIGDKIIFLGMAWPLVVQEPLLALNILFELAISCINVIGRVEGLDTKTVYVGKVKTCFLSAALIAGYLVKFFGFPSFIFSTLMTTTSIAQGITLYEYINCYNRMKLNNPAPIKQKETKHLIQEDTKEKNSQIEELIKEKEFLLSTKESAKKEKNKVKTRKKNTK